MPSPRPGWVYVMTCPSLPPGCCKIGGTAWTPGLRARQLVTEYATGHPFTVVDSVAAADWEAAERSAHRMLWDRRQFREVFAVTPQEAAPVIRAAARATDRPTLWRRLVMPPRSSGPPWGYSRRRRGTNWVPLLLLVLIVAGVVSIAKPAPPSWTPAAIARTVYLLERL